MRKRTMKRIMRSVKKHLLALFYLFMLSVFVIGLCELIYESGILLAMDMILGAIFG